MLLISTKESTPREDLQRFIALETPIIVGTPGRLEEFLQSRNGKAVVRTATLEVLVLDEADRLLDLGFQASLSRILGCLPKQRRTGLFSATLTEASSELIRMGLRNPVRVVVKASIKTVTASGAEGKGKERRTPAGLKNMVVVCPPGRKTETLLRVLEEERFRGVDQGEMGSGKFIVYMATCNQVDYFYRVRFSCCAFATFALLLQLSDHLKTTIPLQVLTKLPQLKDYTISTLHGHLPPSTRTSTLSSFTKHASTSFAPSILLCTDVASRGLDLPDVDVVVQYDPPVDPKSFAHRVGRTARAGRKGRAVVFVYQGREEDYVEFLSLRGIPLGSYPPSISTTPRPTEGGGEAGKTTPELLEQMRTILLSDRELHDRAAKAFTSFLRAYSKHEAGYIFPLKSLDVGALAREMGCLRLPGGKEVKEWKAKKEAERVKREKKRAEREAREGEAEVVEEDLEEEEEEKEEGEGDKWEWQDADVDVRFYLSLSIDPEPLLPSKRLTSPPPTPPHTPHIRAHTFLSTSGRHTPTHRNPARLSVNSTCRCPSR